MRRNILAMGLMAAVPLLGGVASPRTVSNVQPVAPGRGAAEVLPDKRRSRGKQAKPKKRPNRLTISKRVRRKHRRARA